MSEPAKIRAIRMSEDLWALVEEEAARQGISAAQFLREAAVWRLAHHQTSRGELDLDAFLTRLSGVARKARRARIDGSGLPPLRVVEQNPPEARSDAQ